MPALFVTPTLSIPASDLHVNAVRASGPGGQNVNKVASKIELQFDARGCRVLDEGTRQRLIALAGKRVDSDGILHIVSQDSRDQRTNLEDARDKLVAMIKAALVRPRPRRPTKPSRGAKERRLSDKRHSSGKKADRSRRGDD